MLAGGYGGLSFLKHWHVPTLVPGSSHAMVVAWGGDNSGPPSADSVRETFADIQAEFPHTDVVTSSLDDFVAAILDENVTSQLPVLTGEIGDTWIHGVASDPRKLALMSAIERELASCFAQGQCSRNDARIAAFFHAFLKNYEHTWGLDVKSTLRNVRSNYSNTEFHALRHRDDYAKLETSWWRQRDYGIAFAVKQLKDHPLAKSIASAINNMQPTRPDTQGMTQWNGYDPIAIANYTIALNNVTGAIAAINNMCMSLLPC